jgi:hypothetical protein
MLKERPTLPGDTPLTNPERERVRERVVRWVEESKGYVGRDEL